MGLLALVEFVGSAMFFLGLVRRLVFVVLVVVLVMAVAIVELVLEPVLEFVWRWVGLPHVLQLLAASRLLGPAGRGWRLCKQFKFGGLHLPVR